MYAGDQSRTFAEGGGGTDSQGSRAGPLNIDLNQPQEGETASPSPPNKDGASGDFDLNMSPASDNQGGGSAS